MGWRDLTQGALGSCMNTFQTVPVVFRPDGEGGTRRELVCIFDAPHAAIDPTNGVKITSTAPTIGVRLSDFEGDVPKVGDLLEIGSVRYRVSEPPELDGEGGATIPLKRERLAT